MSNQIYWIPETSFLHVALSLEDWCRKTQNLQVWIVWFNSLFEMSWFSCKFLYEDQYIVIVYSVPCVKFLLLS